MLLYPLGIATGFFYVGYWKALAISLDQFGNVLMQHLFNDILIDNKSRNLFGSPDETISSVIGKNKQDGTLTKFGLFISSILDRLDNNHSIKSIEEDEHYS